MLDLEINVGVVKEIILNLWLASIKEVLKYKSYSLNSQNTHINSCIKNEKFYSLDYGIYIIYGNWIWLDSTSLKALN